MRMVRWVAWCPKKHGKQAPEDACDEGEDGPDEAQGCGASRRVGWRRGVPGHAEREAGEAALAWHTAPGAGGWHDAVSLEFAEANPRHRQHDTPHRAGGGGRLPAAPHYAADHEPLSKAKQHHRSEQPSKAPTPAA